MAVLVCLFFVLSYLQNSYAAPGVQQALMYLSSYGYLEPNSMNSPSAITNAKTFRRSIREFQSFIGIPVTGKIDRMTMKFMSMSRCGVKDKIGRANKREKRFALQGSMWKTKNLKYRIAKYPTGLKRNDVDRMILSAFNLWSNNTDLVFEPSTNSSEKVNIQMMFVRGKHGDDNPFEGPGGVLAHAFFPGMGGAIHFDDSEKWTINSPEGTNLLQVANHEIGHSLGLSHSEELEASMSPLYSDYIPNFMLHNDDIQAIQKLYGKRMKSGFKPKEELQPDDPSEYDWTMYWDSFLY